MRRISEEEAFALAGDHECPLLRKEESHSEKATVCLTQFPGGYVLGISDRQHDRNLWFFRDLVAAEEHYDSYTRAMRRARTPFAKKRAFYTRSRDGKDTCLVYAYDSHDVVSRFPDLVVRSTQEWLDKFAKCPLQAIDVDDPPRVPAQYTGLFSEPLHLQREMLEARVPLVRAFAFDHGIPRDWLSINPSHISMSIGDQITGVTRIGVSAKPSANTIEVSGLRSLDSRTLVSRFQSLPRTPLPADAPDADVLRALERIWAKINSYAD